MTGGVVRRDVLGLRTRVTDWLYETYGVPWDFAARHADDLISRCLDAVPVVPPDPPAVEVDAIARVLMGHQVEWIADAEASPPWAGFYECGCNDDGHMNGLLLTMSDVSRHHADALLSSGVLVAVADVRARALEDAADDFELLIDADAEAPPAHFAALLRDLAEAEREGDAMSTHPGCGECAAEAERFKRRIEAAESRVAELEVGIRRLCNEAEAKRSRLAPVVWVEVTRLRALVGDETPGTGEHA